MPAPPSRPPRRSGQPASGDAATAGRCGRAPATPTGRSRRPAMAGRRSRAVGARRSTAGRCRCTASRPAARRSPSGRPAERRGGRADGSGRAATAATARNAGASHDERPSTSRGRPTAGRRGAGRKPARRRPTGAAARRDRAAGREPRTEAERRAAEVRIRRGPRAPRDPSDRAAADRGANARDLDRRGFGARRGGRRGPSRHGRRTPPAPRGADPPRSGRRVGDRRDGRAPLGRAARSGWRRPRRRSTASGSTRPSGSWRRWSGSSPTSPPCTSSPAWRATASGRWNQAISELEAARAISTVGRPCCRCWPTATGRFGDGTRSRPIWREVRAASPAHEVAGRGAHRRRRVARRSWRPEGRDQAAVGRRRECPKMVRDHHLRQWYVLADLYDRAGDTVAAARWFRDDRRHRPDVRRRRRPAARARSLRGPSIDRWQDRTSAPGWSPSCAVTTGG